MARFSDAFLEEVRDAVPVSTVVGRHIKLKKEGREFKGLSPFNKEKTPSFTVNDQKRMWFDFSSGKNGNVFQFEMEHTGCTFEDAVERVAAMAGIAVPAAGRSGQHQARKANGAGSNGHAQGDPRDEPPPHGDEPAATKPRPDKKLVEVFPYCDPDGGLRYEVCRYEWTEGGKRKKTFMQRRPVLGQAGHAWGLKEGEYVQGRSGDWYVAEGDRLEWDGPRVFLEGAAHMLYRLPELREEMAQEQADRRTVFLPEGELKVHVHERWGLFATCASGGARNWSHHHAAELLGADVVIEADNDAPGREGAEKKAISLRGIAARVRVLDWGRIKPGSDKGYDVVDFEKAGGTVEDLWRTVRDLPNWTPRIPETKFGAVRFADIDKPARELQWLVKRVLTRGDVSIWFGPPGCGKSFLITDMALSVARGVPWLGQRVRNGLVCYQAGEGGLGLKKRLRAYRKHNGLKATDDVPFVLMTSRINLYDGDADVDKLAEELRAWRAYYDLPLELVVIDTLSAATPALNENASEDISKVMERCRKVAAEFGCHVAIVHHTPKAGGSPRGHSSLMGNVDSAIEVIRSEMIDRQREDDHDVMRDVREFVVRKQKEDADGFARTFVLKQVVIGVDHDDNEPMTSCIVSQVGEDKSAEPERQAPLGYAIMKGNNLTILRALQKALTIGGFVPPADTKDVPEYTKCVKVADWIAALSELKFVADPADPITEKYLWGAKLYGRCKKAIERTYSEHGWIEKNYIGKAGALVWRTNRKVLGLDEAPSSSMTRRQDAAAIGAPGESDQDMMDALR